MDVYQKRLYREKAGYCSDDDADDGDDDLKTEVIFVATVATAGHKKFPLLSHFFSENNAKFTFLLSNFRYAIMCKKISA